jgi:hypothetical protein
MASFLGPSRPLRVVTQVAVTDVPVMGRVNAIDTKSEGSPS